jgi:uncharacterized protein
LNWFRKKDAETGEYIFKCFRDGTSMRKIKKKGVILDVCPKCGGMWVDGDEIDKLYSLGRKK